MPARIGGPGFRPQWNIPREEPQPGSTTSTTSTSASALRADGFERARNRPGGATTMAGGAQTTGVSGVQATAATSTGGIELNPSEILGNIHSGEVLVDIPLSPELLDHRMIKIGEGAQVQVRFAVKDGQIDFERSRATIEGIKAAGVIQLRGAYFSEKGKLKLDMSGPDINISKALVGSRRVPQDMGSFAKAVEKTLLEASTDEPLELAALREQFPGFQFRAEGVTLHPDKPLSLGPGNAVDLASDHRITVEGDLQQASLSGRVSIDGLALQGEGTEVKLGPGQIDLNTRATLTPQGADVELSLSHIDLDVDALKQSFSGEDGVAIQGGRLKNGQIDAKIQLGDATSLPDVRVAGEFAAEGLQYKQGEQAVEGRDVQFKLDTQLARGADGAVALDHARLEQLAGTFTAPGQRIDLGAFGEVTLGGGRAEFTRASAALGAQLAEGSYDVSGRFTGSLDSGHLKLGDAATLDVREADVDLQLSHLEKREGQPLTFGGDLKMTLDTRATLSPELLKDAGITAIQDPRGALTLDMKGVELTGDGQFEVKRGTAELSASVKSIEGQIAIPELAEGATATGGSSSSSPIDALEAPTAALAPRIDAPLSIDPLQVAGRIQDGVVEVDIPLNEQGLEDLSKILGVRTIDVAPNTHLQTRLVVEDGKINYKESSIRFDKTPEVLGFLDVQPPSIDEHGRIQVEIGGFDFDLTKLATGKERIPSRISSLMEQLPTLPSSPTESSGPLAIDSHLQRGRQLAQLGEIKLKAENVTLAPGRLQLGDNDYIELGPGNALNISGTTRNVDIQGTIDATDAYIDLGDAEFDLGRGEVGFRASIDTGLSRNGRLERPSKVKLSLDVSEASVDHMNVAQPDGSQLSLRRATIKGASLSTSHSFKVADDGTVTPMPEASEVSLSIPHFEGELSNSSLSLTNADGSDASIHVATAKSHGSLRLGNDGRIQAKLHVDEIDAHIEDLTLGLPGASLKGLDGSLVGSGDITFDSHKGLTLEGDFTAGASMEDGRLSLGGLSELDLSRNSRATLRLQQINTMDGDHTVRGDLDLDAALDRGQITLPDGQNLRFEQGSKIRLSGTLSEEQSGALLSMNGELFADLERQKFSQKVGDTTVSGEIYDGVAKIDLGDIEFHEDGRYRIANPDIKVNMDVSLLGRQF